ncbi:hypothetical protein BCR43DRAFT_544312 [Syncephalastrum racemosum]|uniref:Choice-of-anchor A domain-containing protein n=1 Tax=Syncephalastrum racemosum TaxID=13706 RepID=A0A1X2HJ52_SYNRA|nr:hypothetical protein BCR43DRAFT_544312 [Syncephalastrum racemosum]
MVRLSLSACAAFALLVAGLTEARVPANLADIFAPAHTLTRRQITNEGDANNMCPIDVGTYAGQIVTHFTGIFFGDFTTAGGQDILGPLAVRGDFHAPNYVVNANHAIDCTQPIDDTRPYDTIGLIVGGQAATTNTDVHGNSFVAGGGTIDQLNSLDAGCAVYSPATVNEFEWDAVQNGAIATSERLASYTPNVVLQGEGAVTAVGDNGENAYYIFTFDTCETCDITGPLSDPSSIFFGQGNYNGPTGDVPSEDSTVVFNIPVLNGATINLTGNQPSQGWYACRTIYNFYPVDTAGNYLENGEFTLLRHTGSQLEGLILAPRGHILDGTTGAFAGLTIGLDYAWENGATGVEIHDFVAAGCPEYDGCFPGVDPNDDTNTACPDVPTITSTITTTTTTTSTSTITSITTSTESLCTTTITNTDVNPSTTTVTSTTTLTAGTETVYVVPHVVEDEHKHKHWKFGKCKGNKGKGGWKRGWKKDQGGWEDEDEDDECYDGDWDKEDWDESWDDEKGWDKGKGWNGVETF